MIEQTLFSFEETPWEEYLAVAQAGQSLSGAAFLTLLEGQSEENVEDAFLALEQLHVSLDIKDLGKDYGAGAQAARLRQEEKMHLPEDALQQLEQNDPLRLYLEEIGQLPVCADEQSIVAALQENASERLMELSLSRVVELSAQYAGHGVLLLDLIQEGNLGVWNAILSYTPEQDFCAVRDWWIGQFMARAVIRQAREAGVGSKLRQVMEDYRSVDEQLLAQLGRNPTPLEIAQALHVTEQEVLSVAEMLETTRAMHRAKTLEPEELPQEEDQAVEDTAYFQMRQRIEELLSALTPEDAKLLTLRYGLEGGLPLKPQQVAQALGITAEEVTAREAAALSKLRAQ